MRARLVAGRSKLLTLPQNPRGAHALRSRELQK